MEKGRWLSLHVQRKGASTNFSLLIQIPFQIEFPDDNL